MLFKSKGSDTIKTRNMYINEIINLIENFAPLKTQEDWDGSGWQIDFGDRDIKKILMALSLTEDVINQAVEKKCDMVISHHPFIFPHAVPISFNKNIPIYSAHTNLDKADGGTTDTLIETLGFCDIHKAGDFLRIIDLNTEIELVDFVTLLKIKLNLQSVRVVNNLNKQKISKMAFCAGSGADFIEDATKIGADVFVTGDVKYHSAMESDVIIIDVGHFESERPVLKTLEKIIKNKNANIGVVIADEKSPFINY